MSENHRTETAFENSLILKTFVFKVVTSYNYLIYLLFIKRYDTSGTPLIVCNEGCDRS